MFILIHFFEVVGAATKLKTGELKGLTARNESVSQPMVFTPNVNLDWGRGGLNEYVSATERWHPYTSSLLFRVTTYTTMGPKKAQAV